MSEYKKHIEKSFGLLTGVALFVVAAVVASFVIGLVGIWFLGAVLAVVALVVIALLLQTAPLWFPILLVIGIAVGLTYACSEDEPVQIERSLQ